MISRFDLFVCGRTEYNTAFISIAIEKVSGEFRGKGGSCPPGKSEGPPSQLEGAPFDPVEPFKIIIHGFSFTVNFSL